MAITKKEKTDKVRAQVIAMFADKLMGADSQFTQTDSGAFVIMQEFVDAEGKAEEMFVEVKFVVKGDTFDIDDAITAYEDKVAKAKERETVKAVKAAERIAKEKAKAEKAEKKEKAPAEAGEDEATE